MIQNHFCFLLEFSQEGERIYEAEADIQTKMSGLSISKRRYKVSRKSLYSMSDGGEKTKSEIQRQRKSVGCGTVKGAKNAVLSCEICPCEELSEEK